MLVIVDDQSAGLFAGDAKHVVPERAVHAVVARLDSQTVVQRKPAASPVEPCVIEAPVVGRVMGNREGQVAGQYAKSHHACMPQTA